MHLARLFSLVQQLDSFDSTIIDEFRPLGDDDVTRPGE